MAGVVVAFRVKYRTPANWASILFNQDPENGTYANSTLFAAATG